MNLGSVAEYRSEPDHEMRKMLIEHMKEEFGISCHGEQRFNKK